MKKLITILLFLCIAPLCIPDLQVQSQVNPRQYLLTQAQIDSTTPIAKAIQHIKAGGERFPMVDLLQHQAISVSAMATSNTAQAAALQEAVNDGIVVNLNDSQVQSLIDNQFPSITVSLPGIRTGTVELELIKADVYAPNFKVVTSSSDGHPVDYEKGAHYRGVVKGVAQSIAAVSVFRDEIMGFYATEDEGNVVLGKLGGDNANNDHILYAEKDLKATNQFSCDTKEDNEIIPLSELQPQDQAQSVSSCKYVGIYVETDFDIFRNKKSVNNVGHYISGLFNQSAVLYNNEAIPILLTELFIWTSSSPYTASSSSKLLSQFQAYRNSFNGDFGHLLAFRGGGGIAAGFNGFCNSNIDARQCFSGISSGFKIVPTYSWSIGVFTHEIGHLMGSRHTHACVWNGNGTAIDGCAGATEGGCSLPEIPRGGGTIMSYCHLTSTGIKFNLGFGPQPGHLIRNRFNGATCLFHFSPPPTGLVAQGDDMQPGEILNPEQFITSSDGRFVFVFQGDGNLVLYRNCDGRPLWASGTAGQPAAVCIMQRDGNLVIYDGCGRALWASNTWQFPGSSLGVQNDGNVVIYTPSGVPVWATNTVQSLVPTGPVAQGDDMQPGEVLNPNQFITSSDGRYRFIFQSDGNLVLYRNSDGKSLWASGTVGQPAAVCIMQLDGNLVIYGACGQPLWASNTWRFPGSHLIVQNDGNVVIYMPNNKPVWATSTVQPIVRF